MAIAGRERVGILLGPDVSAAHPIAPDLAHGGSTLRIAVAIALARGWSMPSSALSAASDKAGTVRAIRPSCTKHSSSAIDDTASINSSDGSSRNNLANIG